jgi:hypothetical protein
LLVPGRSAVEYLYKALEAVAVAGEVEGEAVRLDAGEVEVGGEVAGDAEGEVAVAGGLAFQGW